MMNVSKAIVTALVLGSLAAGLAGCKKEGPAERAGKEIDKAASEIQKAGDKMKDVVNGIGK